MAVAVALDWTPNTNHTGLYVARSKGYYRDAGLEVQLQSPHQDDYKATPSSRLAKGEALFALVPSETLISHHTWPEPRDSKPRIVAVGAVLQDDTSAIVCLKSSGLERPAQLDGIVYASYGARCAVAPPAAKAAPRTRRLRAAACAARACMRSAVMAPRRVHACVAGW